ncbi:hypothetical protein [Myceligenerans pegani]|uniref:Uncharacterized protein n=1 Tax=Myceligenerans pegani TaxID=2776917 RepID=A0ABR9MYH6_9MICO|nr:hypothetical protein [Myceligenerans sp. TRM 65318]MBE1875842.1 hypothetical protein [Myceligenerans sp. TRM 65318]MBE3018113.1 hypothetical protein [Myceligenerans sp. TRM 65318]
MHSFLNSAPHHARDASLPARVLVSAPPRTYAASAEGTPVPLVPRVYVPRSRFWQHLDDATDGAVTLVVAPVGSGKTMGVAGWLRYGPRPRAHRTTWIAAGPGGGT